MRKFYFPSFLLGLSRVWNKKNGFRWKEGNRVLSFPLVELGTYGSSPVPLFNGYSLSSPEDFGRHYSSPILDMGGILGPFQLIFFSKNKNLVKKKRERKCLSERDHFSPSMLIQLP